MEQSNKFKLTFREREDVIKKYIEGIPVITIAEQYGVSRPTIYNIIEKVKHPNKKIDFYFDKSGENKDMSDLSVEQNNINFLGVKIDTENGASNPKIRKALDKSFQLLDIMKFIEVTKFKLNMTMFDYFWQVVVGKGRLHVSTAILEWFGYEGEYRKQKEAFLKILRRNEITYYELTKKDKEIDQYPSIQKELQIVNEGAQACTKFLIMEPNDLKIAIMQLKTKNGHIIRQYYIDLEELLKLYVEYTLYFNHRESQRKITNLEQMMARMDLEREQDRQYMRSLGISLEEVKDQNEELLEKNEEVNKKADNIQRKLNIAVEDRAPQPEDESKRERFVLLKRNDPEFMAYYTIRAQYAYTTRKLKIELVHFPNLVVLLDFKCSPNSKTLYNRIKENLKAKEVIFKGNNIDLNDAIEEQELIDEMKVINDQKYDV